jgi:hypothetical protein
VGHILTFVIENLWGTKNKKKIYFKRHENRSGHKTRSGPKTKAAIPTTKYDHLTFKFFFQKLLGTFKNFNFNIKKNAFKSRVDLEIKIYQKVFSKDFPISQHGDAILKILKIRLNACIILLLLLYLIGAIFSASLKF